MTPKPTRPVMRYHGGKWKLAPWIISHFPPHRIYVEAFGGAASVLLRKPRSFAEVYNDLDGEIVNVFRVLRDRVQAAELMHLLKLTPFAREEFDLSYEPSEDPIEQARRTIVRSFMSYSSDGVTRSAKTGFRAKNLKSGRFCSREWVSFVGPYQRNGYSNPKYFVEHPSLIGVFHERLHGVCIENKPALELIRSYDTNDTLFYLDPPYVHASRNKSSAGRAYRYEMTNDEHTELLDAIRGMKGMVVLSGYRNDLYDSKLADWERVETDAIAQSAQASKKTVECLWISPSAWSRLPLRLALEGI